MNVSEEAERFGRQIREFRISHGLSQIQLAETAGCSQRFVSELERGKATAELGKALDVASALGLTPLLVPGPSRNTVATEQPTPKRHLADYL